MKNSKHNINSLEKSSIAYNDKNKTPSKFIGNYKDLRDFKMKPATEDFIERLAKLLMQWVEVDERAYKLNQFFRMQGLPPDMFYDWCNKYPVLKEAHQYAMRCIGDRRELNAMERKIETSMVLKTLYLYDPMHAQARKDEIEAKKEIAKAGEEQQRPTQIILGQLSGLDQKELVE